LDCGGGALLAAESESAVSLGGLAVKYRLLRLNPSQEQPHVYEGSFAKVYRAVEASSGREVVIKKLKVRQGNSGFTRREKDAFRQEVAKIQVLHHPWIPAIIDVSAEDMALVMPYQPGKDMEAALVENEGPLGLPCLVASQAKLVAVRLIEVVEYIHMKNMAHYDIKPANVWLCDDGGGRVLYCHELHALLTCFYPKSAAAGLRLCSRRGKCVQHEHWLWQPHDAAVCSS